MIEPFVHDPLPTRVIFGSGTLADGIEEVVERTVADPYWNPRPLERAAIQDPLTRAWNGEPPRSP
jgi:maleylacetate reductase